MGPRKGGCKTRPYGAARTHVRNRQSMRGIIPSYSYGRDGSRPSSNTTHVSCWAKQIFFVPHPCMIWARRVIFAMHGLGKMDEMAADGKGRDQSRPYNTPCACMVSLKRVATQCGCGAIGIPRVEIESALPSRRARSL